MNDAGAAEIGEKNSQTEQPTQEWPTFRTAFLVFQDRDGQWAATNDANAFGQIGIEKIAHPDEMDAGCAALRTDIAAQKTAAMIQGLMMQAAKQAQEAQMNAAIMAQTGLKIK